MEFLIIPKVRKNWTGLNKRKKKNSVEFGGKGGIFRVKKKLPEKSNKTQNSE